MKKFALILLVSAAPSFARVLTFVPLNFDEFVSKMIPEKEQKLFKGFYSEFKNKMAKEKEKLQIKTRHYIHSKAFASLEENHAVWSAEVNEFLTDRRFLDESYDYLNPQKTSVGAGRCILRTRGLSAADLEKYQRIATRKFYLRPKQIFVLLRRIRSRHQIAMFLDLGKAFFGINPNRYG